MSSTGSRGSCTRSNSDTPDDLTEASSVPPSDGFVEIPPNHSNEGVIRRVEDLFQSMVDSILNGVELTIPYRTRNSRIPLSTTRIEITTHRYETRSRSASHSTTQNGDPTQSQRDVLIFPAHNLRKQKRFSRRALSTCLDTGYLLTLLSVFVSHLGSGP